MPETKSLIRLITFCHLPQDQTIPLIETVEIPLGKTPPPHRLICLYGNPLAGLKRIRSKAKKEQNKVYRVDLDIERGDLITGNTSLDNIGATKIVSLDRVDAKLSEALYEILIQDNDKVEFDNPNYIIGQHPDRLNLIWEDPRFSHLSVIAWSAPVSSDRPIYEKHAVLKSLDLIVKKDILNYSGDPEAARFLI